MELYNHYSIYNHPRQDFPMHHMRMLLFLHLLSLVIRLHSPAYLFHNKYDFFLLYHHLLYNYIQNRLPLPCCQKNTKYHIFCLLLYKLLALLIVFPHPMYIQYLVYQYLYIFLNHFHYILD